MLQYIGKHFGFTWGGGVQDFATFTPNCTLQDGERNNIHSRVVEVQLRERAFYIKKGARGVKWNAKTSGSPMVAWSQKGATSMEDVWKIVVDKVGGWD